MCAHLDTCIRVWELSAAIPDLSFPHSRCLHQKFTGIVLTFNEFSSKLRFKHFEISSAYLRGFRSRPLFEFRATKVRGECTVLLLQHNTHIYIRPRPSPVLYLILSFSFSLSLSRYLTFSSLLFRCSAPPRSAFFSLATRSPRLSQRSRSRLQRVSSSNSSSGSRKRSVFSLLSPSLTLFRSLRVIVH